MLHTQPPVPTRAKHVVYLVSTTVLGILLSFLVHAGIEITYLGWADAHQVSVSWYNGCALPPIIQILLPALGAIGGFALGRWWWRIVYIEQRWLKHPKSADTPQ